MSHITECYLQNEDVEFVRVVDAEYIMYVQHFYLSSKQTEVVVTSHKMHFFLRFACLSIFFVSHPL